jgi:prepilin-type N-terminal cleavage/methylation domain-containing protein
MHKTTPHSSKQKGLTLVELAIVLSIIGLLVIGILKGDELMNKAKGLSSSCGDEESYETDRDTECFDDYM